MATYVKLEAEFVPDSEQRYEITTPVPSTKRIVTISEIDREMEGLQSQIASLTAMKTALETKKAELLKL